VNAEVIQLGRGHVGKASLRAFERRRKRAKWSGGRVATKGKVKMGEEDDTVNSKTTSALGGMREALNKENRPEELIDEFVATEVKYIRKRRGKKLDEGVRSEFDT